MQRKSILMNSKPRSLSTSRLECSVCKQHFWMTSKYLDHMSSHKHFLLSCNICNKGFYNQKHLDEHYLTHKEVINTYDCNKCPRKFLQKYQLEQHMKFHLLSVTSPPVEIKKKKVRFNNILQSKNISDEEFSSDDSLEENAKDISKITTTRSGRVVKTKKVFENEEPEVKSKRRKKFEEIFENTAIIGDNTSVTTENRSVIGDNTSVTSEKASVIGNNTSVTNEKAPVSKNASTICESNLPSKVDNVVSVSSNLSNECILSKSLCVAEKVPNDLLKKCFGKRNTYVPEISESNFVVLKSDQNKVNCSQESLLMEDNMSHFQTTVSQNCKSSVNKTELHQESKSVTKAKVLSLTQAPLLNPTLKTVSSIKPVADKQFLYVGSKQDMGKIKRVIEEVKNMSMINADEGFSKAPAFDISKSSIESDIYESSPASTKLPNANIIERSVFPSESSSPPKSEKNVKNVANNGILDKRVVNDFLVVKVTPELMKEMQKRNQMSQKGLDTSGVLEKAEVNINSQNISSVSSSISPEITNQKKDEQKETVKLCNDTEIASKKNEKLPFKISETLKETHINLDSTNVTCMLTSVVSAISLPVKDQTKDGEEEAVELSKDSEVTSNQNERSPLKTSEILKKNAINPDVTNVACTSSSVSTYISVPALNQKKDEEGEAVKISKNAKMTSNQKKGEETIKLNKNSEISSNQNERSTPKNSETLTKTAINLDITYKPSSVLTNKSIPAMKQKKDEEEEAVKISKNIEITSNRKKDEKEEAAKISKNIEITSNREEEEEAVKISKNIEIISNREEEEEAVKISKNIEIISNREEEEEAVKISKNIEITSNRKKDEEEEAAKISKNIEITSNQKKDEEKGSVKFKKDLEIISNQKEKLSLKTSETLKQMAINPDATGTSSNASTDISIPVINQKEEEEAVKFNKDSEIISNQNKDVEKETVKLNKDSEINLNQKEKLSLKTSETLKETAINPDATNVASTPSIISSSLSISALNQKKNGKIADKLKKVSKVISNQNKKLCLKPSENLKNTAVINIDKANISSASLNILKIVVINQKKFEGKEAIKLQKDTEITSKQNKTPFEPKSNFSNCNVVRSYITEQVPQENKTTVNRKSKVQVLSNINSSNINISDTKSTCSDIIQTSVKECIDQQNGSATNEKLSINPDVQANKSMSVYSSKIMDSKLSDACNIAVKTSDACNITVKTNSTECIPKLHENSHSTKKSIFPMPTAQPNDTNDPVIKMSNKILKLFKAKMEEKERKKKEKYEQKKKQRYTEKKLNKQTNHSVSIMQNSKRTKFDDSDEIGKKPSVIFSEDNTLKLAQICHKSHEGQNPEDEMESENCWKSDTSNKNLGDKDAFCVSSIVIGETYTVKWPESNDSNVIHDSAIHAGTPNVQDFDNFMFNADENKDQDSDLQMKSTESAEEEAIREAQQICSEFEKALSKEEYLKYLDKLDDLIFSFNISSKCSFVFQILRFCRKHEDYGVNIKAIELNKKMLKSLSSS